MSALGYLQIAAHYVGIFLGSIFAIGVFLWLFKLAFGDR